MDLSIAKLKNSLMKVNLTLKSSEIKGILSQNVSRLEIHMFENVNIKF